MASMDTISQVNAEVNHQLQITRQYVPWYRMEESISLYKGGAPRGGEMPAKTACPQRVQPPA